MIKRDVNVAVIIRDSFRFVYSVCRKLAIHANPAGCETSHRHSCEKKEKKRKRKRKKGKLEKLHISRSPELLELPSVSSQSRRDADGRVGGELWKLRRLSRVATLFLLIVARDLTPRLSNRDPGAGSSNREIDSLKYV